MNNRLAHGSISSTASSNDGRNESNQPTTPALSASPDAPTTDNALLLGPITDPIAVPVPPPSPEVPGYYRKCFKEPATIVSC